VTPEDHRRGAANAAVTLVEYGDFESPECAEFYRILKSMPEDLSTNWQHVFRHIPLVRFHRHAVEAAEAAEAASAQGLFWDLHDAMFEHQAALSADFIRTMARRLGVDLQRYDADMRAHNHAVQIKGDVASAARSGVDAAPTLFIDSVRYEGPIDETALMTALKKRIAAVTPPAR
jgi:protein-disulfide isomerase